MLLPPGRGDPNDFSCDDGVINDGLQWPDEALKAGWSCKCCFLPEGHDWVAFVEEKLTVVLGGRSCEVAKEREGC